MSYWVSLTKKLTDEEIQDGEDDEVYSESITTNLFKMACQAGVDKYIFEDDNSEKLTGKDAIDGLTKGLAVLIEKPDHFRQFDAKPGWGRYENILEFVTKYLKACTNYPDAVISIHG